MAVALHSVCMLWSGQVNSESIGVHSPDWCCTPAAMKAQSLAWCQPRSDEGRWKKGMVKEGCSECGLKPGGSVHFLVVLMRMRRPPCLKDEFGISPQTVSELQSPLICLECLQSPDSTKLSGFPGKLLKAGGFTDQLNLARVLL